MAARPAATARATPRAAAALPPAPATAPHDEPAIASAILALLATRAAEATICPSEVARALAPEAPAWRALMPHVRQAAARLAAEGRVRVTRGGRPVDALAAHGPIRIGHATGDGKAG